MELKKNHELTFENTEKILCTVLLNRNEFVALSSDGNVFKWNAADNKGEHLFWVNDSSYRDGGFDKNSSCIMYAMDEIVVVVNEFKLHGYVYNPKIGRSIHLYRKDYHALHSSYPIALFKNTDGVPHIIYGVAWNHLQIMNLETRQILTVAKSLIEVNAEQKHIDFYATYEDHNKLPWPSPYDYFFGQISMSPDNNRFLSRGWSWGSSDSYKVYDLEHFINNSRIQDRYIYGGEHLNRPACWIDNDTIVSTYYPYRDDDAKEKSTHIVIVKLDVEEPLKQFNIHKSEEITGELYFNSEKQLLVSIAKETGTLIFDLDGKEIFKDVNFKPLAYYPAIDSFINLDNRTISVYQIEY